MIAGLLLPQSLSDLSDRERDLMVQSPLKRREPGPGGHPSGGGLHALELSLLVRAVDGLEPGVYHYVPATDGLETVRTARFPFDFVTYLFMGQHLCCRSRRGACALGRLRALHAKYGDRGHRYLWLEIGHAAQNFNLLAEALGFGSCNLGGFFAVELSDLLRLDLGREAALYAIAVGAKRTPAAS